MKGHIVGRIIATITKEVATIDMFWHFHRSSFVAFFGNFFSTFTYFCDKEKYIFGTLNSKQILFCEVH